jgi:hypothetical protein
LRFHVVAVAFDGTLDTDGHVPDSTVAALESLRASRRRLMLVSSRAPDDLQSRFPRIDLFDRVVPDADGLQAALDDLALSARNTVGIGASTDDLPFLDLCECAVAVPNGPRALKRKVDIVADSPASKGLEELIAQLLEDDLDGVERSGHGDKRIRLGTHPDSDKPVFLPTFGTRLLVTGTGRSNVLPALADQLLALGYQFCLVDPEAVYRPAMGRVVLDSPQVEDVVAALGAPGNNVHVTLSSVPREQWADFGSRLAAALADLVSRTGRPHWLIVQAADALLQEALAGAGSLALLATDPRRMAMPSLHDVTMVLALGNNPRRTLAAVAELVTVRVPSAPRRDLRKSEGVLWQRGKKRSHVIDLLKRRKGRPAPHVELAPERSFYFRGPVGSVDARASSLQEFLERADEVDNATWLHHLAAGDYASWIELSVGDRKLARAVAQVASSSDATDPQASRAEVRRLVERRLAGT